MDAQQDEKTVEMDAQQYGRTDTSQSTVPGLALRTPVGMDAQQHKRSDTSQSADPGLALRTPVGLDAQQHTKKDTSQFADPDLALKTPDTMDALQHKRTDTSLSAAAVLALRAPVGMDVQPHKRTDSSQSADLALALRPPVGMDAQQHNVTDTSQSTAPDLALRPPVGMDVKQHSGTDSSLSAGLSLHTQISTVNMDTKLAKKTVSTLFAAAPGASDLALDVCMSTKCRKSFDITYVRLKFFSSRPESFAIYKRTHMNGPWIPYQFYSASCVDTYTLRTRDIITRDDETKAICTDEYSDISPLTGGSVAFSTLEGRPSAYDFEHSPVMQEWVTATDIRIVLTRMNTFGDEVFGDPNVLQSYFYAISDFAVGGRCKCNGHASQCTLSTGQGLEDRLVCQCEHNTKGADCGECDDFYNDQPWQRATMSEAHECQACDCSGLSDRCYFDAEMYERTGHGGHCIECREDTFGVHCERCRDHFYRRSEQERCQPCECDPVGSANLQCDTSGRCECKQGVTGAKCDRCMPNFYDLGPAGCRPCACLIAGSMDNNPVCLPNTGVCSCKEFTEGQNCDQCKPGYFNLEEDNRFGCISCYCYGHSSICTSADGYGEFRIESNFESGTQRWIGTDRDLNDIPIDHDNYEGVLSIFAPSVTPVYFAAPDRYLGDQRFSYGQTFDFMLRLDQDSGIAASVLDVVLEGDGLTVSTPIYAQGNPVPSREFQLFSFRLNEHRDYQWTPSLDAFDFIRLLSNLTAIKIRATYTPGGTGYIDDVILHSAQQGYGFGEVGHVEQCTCPEGYIGQFCEDCAPGYHRDPPNGGPRARCIPCNCNGHSDTCDVDSGRCICQHNTDGDNCEMCAEGYYGYALAGTEEDCTKCPCPENGECVEMLDGDVVCINCEEGYTGARCDMCTDGYYGDPQGRYGPPRPCTRCVCNDNVDFNAVGNCNTTNGECLKCIYNTGGYECGSCLPGFYGDALSLPKGQCLPCNCYVPGSRSTGDDVVLCNGQTGQCPCLPSVIGRQCDMCIEGYWNIDSGFGCDACRCDSMGSHNNSCDIHDGQCPCKDGVGGQTCAQCLDFHYGFSSRGCKACNCDPEGSLDLQCDERTGQCPCQTNVEGERCDRCLENKFNITAGCIDCPKCYNLVQERVTMHRQKLHELRLLIENVGNDPGAIDDENFRRRLTQVNETVNQLHRDAMGAIGSDGPLVDQLVDIEQSIEDLTADCGRIVEDIASARDAYTESSYDIETAEIAIDEAEDRLREAESDMERDGQGALREAREAQERFGQQSSKMTQIAQQAREEAERQEDEAMRIEETALDALNTSQEAMRIAREALDKPSRTAHDIEELRRAAQEGESHYVQTQAMAERALQQAQEAYQDSLDILTEAQSIALPEIDVATLEVESQDIKTEAARIKEGADRLIEQHHTLMEEVDQQKLEAEELLEDGIRQQQIADELLADADVARDIARDAILKAEKTISDANTTLTTLKEFDAKKQQSQEEAEAALERVPEIESQIEEAEAKTQDAQTNLAGAESDAVMARDIAQDAQSIAEMASDEADNIRAGAAETRQRAAELKEDAERYAEDVLNSEDNLRDFQDQATTDEQLAREALQKADQAKTSAEFSSSRVSGALEAVNDILNQLANLDSINTGSLDELEQNLDDVELRLEEANLTGKYNQLFDSHQKQHQWVEDYTNELIKLKEDVENIRIINETIPRTCFREIELEPTDPTG